jgi:hypothetical protein
MALLKREAFHLLLPVRRGVATIPVDSKTQESVVRQRPGNANAWVAPVTTTARVRHSAFIRRCMTPPPALDEGGQANYLFILQDSLSASARHGRLLKYFLPPHSRCDRSSLFTLFPLRSFPCAGTSLFPLRKCPLPGTRRRV